MEIFAKSIRISPKSDTLIFFSKTAVTIFLVFGLKLVLNMSFNLNEIYFSEKCPIWRYLEIFDLQIVKKLPKLRFLAIFLTLYHYFFLDFAHDDRCVWCLVFLQFAGPVNVFLLSIKFCDPVYFLIIHSVCTFLKNSI